MATEFGAFLDSVMDRFSDITLFIGLIALYNRIGTGRMDYVLTTSLAMMFSVMTSYTRARAESLIEKCKVGFLERPERIVLFMIGAFTNRMAAVMWVILVLSIVTVLDRIYMTWRELKAGRSLAAVKAGTAPPPIPPTQPGIVQRARGPARHDRLARPVLDLRARLLAVRRDGDPHPRVHLADLARLARRPHGHRRAGAYSVALSVEARSQKGQLTLSEARSQQARCTPTASAGCWLLASGFY